MLLNVVMIGDKELVAKFDEMPRVIRQVLRTKIEALTLKLEALVKAKLSGQVLNVKTGALRRSIFKMVSDDGTMIQGKVGSSGDVKYARIHEFGGTIKHPGGTAYFWDTKAAAIRFISNAAASAQGWPLPRTAPHDIKMPERSFLRSSLKEMREQITSQLRLAVVEGAKEALGQGATT